ncbi:hypothetical protein ACROYT_G019615 [Oculina patagonica]
MTDEVVKQGAKAAAEAARAVLDLSISPSGFSVTIKTDSLILAGIATVGALSLGAFYVANRSRVENAVRNCLENRNEAGIVDPEVRNIEESSILVELFCHSERSFLQFVEDFEAQIVKHRLEEEFAKIGFQQKLTVTIINADEVYKKVKEIRFLQGPSNTKEPLENEDVKNIAEISAKQRNDVAIPICIPNNCKWDETSGIWRHQSERRTGLQLVNAALQKLRAIQGPVCVVSIAGSYRRGKSYILSEAFNQGYVFPVGHWLDTVTIGIWMWVVPDKYTDDHGREFTVVLLNSEGTDAVGADGMNDHSIFTLNIINIPQLIQVIAGKPLDEEDSRNVFPSFVWLLRDVTRRLPKDVVNVKEYFLEKVFKPREQLNDKSQKFVRIILRFFPDFDAFSLHPPMVDPDVLQNVTEEGRQGKINSSFLKEFEDFKQMLRTKLSPKPSFAGKGFMTGEALATLVEEYVRALNSPGAVPVVQSAWNVFTKTKCTQALKDAKAVYDAGMNEFRESVRLPCDGETIWSSHKNSFLEALTLFKRETEDTAARRIFMEEFMNYADEAESVLQRENNNLTEEKCNELMKTLRMEYLDPVLKDLQDADYNEFFVLGESLRSAYRKLDSEFRQQASGSKSLCSTLSNIYELRHREEMNDHLAKVEKRRFYFKHIARESVAREAEAKQRENILVESEKLSKNKEEVEVEIARLETSRTESP